MSPDLLQVAFFVFLCVVARSRVSRCWGAAGSNRLRYADFLIVVPLPSRRMLSFFFFFLFSFVFCLWVCVGVSFCHRSLVAGGLCCVGSGDLFLF